MIYVGFDRKFSNTIWKTPDYAARCERLVYSNEYILRFTSNHALFSYSVVYVIFFSTGVTRNLIKRAVEPSEIVGQVRGFCESGIYLIILSSQGLSSVVCGWEIFFTGVIMSLECITRNKYVRFKSLFRAVDQKKKKKTEKRVWKKIYYWFIFSPRSKLISTSRHKSLQHFNFFWKHYDKYNTICDRVTTFLSVNSGESCSREIWEFFTVDCCLITIAKILFITNRFNTLLSIRKIWCVFVWNWNSDLNLNTLRITY